MGWIASSRWSGRAVRLIAPLTLVGVSVASGQRPVESAPIRSGTLSFDGKATLGDFTGTTTTVTGELAGGTTLPEVRGWVEAPVATLKTGNNRRDKDLNKSMESAKFPTIRFDLEQVRTTWERGDSAAVELIGKFTIHGVTLARTFDAMVLFENGAIRLTTSLPLNLKDYQIGGLTKFLGTIKMHPDILVHIDLVFGR